MLFDDDYSAIDLLKERIWKVDKIQKTERDFMLRAI